MTSSTAAQPEETRAIRSTSPNAPENPNADPSSTNAPEQPLHPILTLPNELMSEIFIRYLPPYPHCPPLLGDGSPTKLTQICRHWRQIAHHTPALWRAVELFMLLRHADFMELQLDTASAWLLRTGGLPLCVVLGNSTSGRAGQDHARNALRLLLDHRTRWEYAALHLSVATWVPGHPTECDMPMLREFDLKYWDTSTENDLDGTLNAPALSTAFLDCDFARPELVPLVLTWSQMTRLCLRHSRLSVVAAILRDAPNVVQCNILLTAIGEVDFGAQQDPWKFERLETLVVTAGFSDCAEVDAFLLAFRAPNLRCLHVDADMLDHRAGKNAATFPKILAAMGCHLEQLSISNANQSFEEFRAVLPNVGRIDLQQRPPEEWGVWALRAHYGSEGSE
ncbi:F-box domain-containing protein [Mycena chlorophos]|uniref:F-box domain-containing protein n=1 Tax=Mycena chlorophos TaxID=658473 RepID=A0A8H6TNM8_MYCCL|nr:F-box domain-containing protein [Mycena chlorophos]